MSELKQFKSGFNPGVVCEGIISAITGTSMDEMVPGDIAKILESRDPELQKFFRKFESIALIQKVDPVGQF